MTDDGDDGQIAKFRLTRAVALARIRVAMKRGSGSLVWGDHALSRMSERDIFDSDVLRVLRGGYIDDEPTLTKGGEWQCKVVRQVKGGRDVGAVVIFLRDGRLFLKTVEWEDVR